MTFVLYPMATEVGNAAYDIPSSSTVLLAFVEQMKNENPGLKFDLSLMTDSLKNDNTWFIKQFANDQIREELLSKITDPSDMNNVYDVVMTKYREGNGLETGPGTYFRVQKLK
jgi:hypothetical protein